MIANGKYVSDLALAASAVVVFALSPLYTAVVLAYYLSVGLGNAEIRPVAYFLGVALTILGIVLVNIAKEPTSDWLWYLAHYHYVSQNGLDIYFSLTKYTWGELASVRNIRPETTEPLFYVVAWVVGQVSSGSEAALSAAVVTLVYVPVALATTAIGRHVGLSRAEMYVTTVIVLLVGMSVMLTTHLVRQQLAAAYLVPVIYFVWQRKYLWCAVFAAIAVGFHNSAAIILALIGAATILSRLPNEQMRVLGLMATVAVMPLLHGPLASSGRVDASNEGASISLGALAVDVTLVILMLAERHRHRNSEIFRIVASLVILQAVMLLVFRDVNILYVRMFFFLDVTRCIVLIIVVPRLVRQIGRPAAAVLVVLAMAYADVRLVTSAFSFGSSLAFPWS